MKLFIFSLFIFVLYSCSALYDDQKIKICVYDKTDSSAIAGIKIRLTKAKFATSLFSEYKLLETYFGNTDSTGKCTIIIEDFEESEEYQYLAWINEEHLAFDGYCHSYSIETIDNADPAKEILTYLTRIPFPDITGTFP